MLCKPGVVIISALEDKRLVLIRQFRHAGNDFSLEFPAGLIDENESGVHCAIRELEEEAGFRAAKVEALGSFFTSPGMSDEQLTVVFASELTETKQQATADEFILGVELFSPIELERAIARGEVTNGTTIVAFAMARAQNLV